MLKSRTLLLNSPAWSLKNLPDDIWNSLFKVMQILKALHRKFTIKLEHKDCNEPSLKQVVVTTVSDFIIKQYFRPLILFGFSIKYHVNTFYDMRWLQFIIWDS